MVCTLGGMGFVNMQRDVIKLEELLPRQVAMISSKDQPIPPLTRTLLPTVPWFLKWSGWVNNRWNESVVDTLLTTRDQPVVRDTWEATLPDADLVERVLAAIGNEKGWQNPRFIPKAVFRCVKLCGTGCRLLGSGERCMWAIEKICGKRPPSSILSTVMDMTLGNFLVHFQKEAHE